MPMPWGLIAAACIGMFAATASGSIRSPFLPDMAVDFTASLPAIANLFGVTSVAWGTSAFLAGRYSDRIGRRPFLLGAPLVLAAGMVGVATVTEYWFLVACVLFSGFACGSFTATSMAEVSLRTENNQRGRALGWVMSGQSLTLLIGVPLAAWLGALVGWRGVHLAIAGLAVFSSVCVFIAIRRYREQRSTSTEKKAVVPLLEALSGPLVRLFAALVVERVCFGLSTFYYPAYLRTAYDLEIDEVALPLLVFAVGNIAGTIIGGYVADKFPYRRINFAVMLLASGGFALPWFYWQPGLGVTITLGVMFSVFNALGRPSLLAAMADVPEKVRGVVMGLNSSIASIGWLTAALVGGWLYSSVGFEGFGILMVVMSVAGALMVIPDSRLLSHK